MRIRLLTLMCGPQGNYFPGQIFYLPDDAAQELIAGGFAQAAPLSEVEKGATAASQRETATQTRRETRSKAKPKKQEEGD